MLLLMKSCVMDGSIGLELQKQPTIIIIMESKEFTLERIVERCKKNYVNILPHNIAKKPEPERVMIDRCPPKKQFSKSQISQMLIQLNSIIQLLTQNYIMAQDKELKSKCYKLIKQFKNRMLIDLDHFDGLMMKKSNTKLLRHKVNFSDMLGIHRMEIHVEMAPQVSIYQDPLLCYVFQPYVHSEIFKNEVYEDVNHAVDIIERHVPVFNKLLIPLIEQEERTRSKFTKVDDRILLSAMVNFGYKNSKLIKSLYFKDRDEEQIRNRIKNLCAKPSNHPVRVWRISEEEELTDAEMKKLVRIFEELGPRWKVISRYYNLKTQSYFESKYDANLKLEKYKDQHPTTGENKFMVRFRQFQQEMRIFNQPEQLYIVNGSNFDNISDNGDEWGCDNTQMVDIDMQVEIQVNSSQDLPYQNSGTQQKLQHFHFKPNDKIKQKENSTHNAQLELNKKKKKVDREKEKEIAMDIEREILSMKRKHNEKEFNMGGDIEVDSLREMEVEMIIQERAQEYRVINGHIFRYEEL